MKLTLIRTLILAALSCATLTVASAFSASAESNRTLPVWDKWSVGCGNSGLCFSSTFVREQSIWLDIRIVRDWPALAAPLLRLTANVPLENEGSLSITVDGKTVDALPVAQLREMQPSVTNPAGFRPLGGEGFWYPTGPATAAVLEAMELGAEMVVTLPIGPDRIDVKVPLNGLKKALEWLDTRQNRNGTVSAIILTGEEPARDAPHAIPVQNPETLPPIVLESWDANRFCSDIDPAIFASLDAIAAPMPDKSTLYLLPCGAPSAYNTPYVMIQALDSGKARQVHVARMSELGPITTDIVYNARWNAGMSELVSHFKGSGVGDCGTWTRWSWSNSGFVLKEEAARQTCDGKEVPITDWATTWHAPKAAE